MPTATTIDAAERILANKLWSPSDAMIATSKILKKRDREVDYSIESRYGVVREAVESQSSAARV